MHSCPRCGLACDCSGDWDDFEVMTPEWVYQNCQCDCEDMDDDDDDFEPAATAVVGYYCIGCGNIQDEDGHCNRCTGYSMEPLG